MALLRPRYRDVDKPGDPLVEAKNLGRQRIHPHTTARVAGKIDARALVGPFDTWSLGGDGRIFKDDRSTTRNPPASGNGEPELFTTIR